ncbi:MAG: protein kinase [Proteobacteria bacterium]|nr:protein kinase [Pseudomonadota bacterium]
MMSAERNQLREALYGAALALDPAEQAAFLARECARDPILQKELEVRLAATATPVANFLGSTVTADHQCDNLATPARGQDQDCDNRQRELFSPGICINQYELIRELGRGGMGVVFLARDLKLARRVAIKFLLKNRADKTDRFLVEARTTARCRHENIVVIHDIDEHRGTPFMVLEYLQGRSLRHLLDDGPLSPRRTIDLAIQVARALKQAHAHSIVHRDLKPENIFLTDSGIVKVLDFGVAKLLGSPVDKASLQSLLAGLSGTHRFTHTGSVVGTLPYMSPEQLSRNEVDYRTDLWAMGILLLEMVSGRHPLEPMSLDKLVDVANLDTALPRACDVCFDLPDRFGDIIDRCLIKDREKRIGSAGELVDALEALRPRRRRDRLAEDACPYPGLLAFQESDADHYFGRARDIAAVLARVQKQPLVAITGPTGIGKSSFVRAGVLPVLADSDESWNALIVRPGRDPMAALASAVLPLLKRNSQAAAAPSDLVDPIAEERALLDRFKAEPGHLGALLRRLAHRRNTTILLVVDPFEELYTLTHEADARRAFTACLAGAADDAAAPVRVMISIRSDFLDRIAEDRAFAAELTGNLVFLTSPDRQGLSEALTRPAENAGYRFESSSMVAEILHAVESAPNSLPLLQFAADKLWQARDRTNRLLTERSYREIGGLVGALTSHADKVVAEISSFSAHAPALIKAIFRCLVTPERTRAIASVDELRELASDPGTVQQILDHLAAARLLVVSAGQSPGHPGREGAAEFLRSEGAGPPVLRSTGPTVEIIHESLIHSWPRLRRWLDEDEENAAFLGQLNNAAKQWRVKGRPQGLLWRGDAFEEARRFRQRYTGPLSTLQNEYLDAVLALASRNRRIKRFAIVGTMTLLAVIAVASSMALVWIRNAEARAASMANAAGRAKQQVLDRDKQLQEKNRDLRSALDRSFAETRRAEDESRRARAAEKNALNAKRRAEQQSHTLRVTRTEALAAKQRAEIAEAEARKWVQDLRAALQREKRLRHRVQKRLDDFEKRYGSDEIQGLR